jgi:hypothetical protein
MESLIEESSTGGKARGLLTLPPSWVPEFFTIHPELNLGWANRDRGTSLYGALSQAQRVDLRFALSRFGEPADAASLYVRSNAVHESLALRGLLKSERSDATVEGVVGAAERIYASAPQSIAAGSIGLIIQAYYPATRSGHLRTSAELQRSGADGYVKPMTAMRQHFVSSVLRQ